MATKEEVKVSQQKIASLIKEGNTQDKDDDYWLDVGARILILIDEVVKNSFIVNSLVPKVYSNDDLCLLELMLSVLDKMKAVNRPFICQLWKDHINKRGEAESPGQIPIAQENYELSFYELAFSRFCSFTCQLLGDRFPCIQKLLIKHIFGQSYICSYFSSDVYMFLIRIIHPHKKMGMVQLIMNICKLAPPTAFVKGAALINRIKHPIVNFEHANYQYLLDLS